MYMAHVFLFKMRKKCKAISKCPRPRLWKEIQLLELKMMIHSHLILKVQARSGPRYQAPEVWKQEAGASFLQQVFTEHSAFVRGHV